MADVTVKLTIGNFSAEVTGPAEYVDKKLGDLVERFLGSWKPSIGPTETRAATPAPQAGKQLSPAEFLKKKNPKKQTDRALMLAYYLEKFQSLGSFTSGELGELANTVRDPFGNVSDVIGRLTSRGLMMSAGEKEGQRAYALTASGETYVEESLEDS
jgi:hypothetical protein